MNMGGAPAQNGSTSKEDVPSTSIELSTSITNMLNNHLHASTHPVKNYRRNVIPSSFRGHYKFNPEHRSKYTSTTGYVDIQFEVVPLKNVADLQYVYGAFKLKRNALGVYMDGSNKTGTVVDTFQGVYMPKLNRFTMLSTTTASHKLILQVTAVSSNTSITDGDTSHSSTGVNSTEGNDALADHLNFASRELLVPDSDNPANEHSWESSEASELTVSENSAVNSILGALFGREQDPLDFSGLEAIEEKFGRDYGLAASEDGPFHALLWHAVRGLYEFAGGRITRLVANLGEYAARVSASAFKPDQTTAETTDQASAETTAQARRLLDAVAAAPLPVAHVTGMSIIVEEVRTDYDYTTSTLPSTTRTYEEGGRSIETVTTNLVLGMLSESGVPFVFDHWFTQLLYTDSMLSTAMSNRLPLCQYSYALETNHLYSISSQGASSGGASRLNAESAVGIEERRLGASTIPSARSVGGEVRTRVCYSYVEEESRRLRLDESSWRVPERLLDQVEVISTAAINISYAVFTTELQEQLQFLSYKTNMYGLLSTLLICSQLYATSAQLKYVSTPAVASKVALEGIYLQMMLDLFVQFWHLLFLASSNSFQFYFLLVIVGSLSLWVLQMLMLVRVYNSKYSNVPDAVDVRTYLWHVQVRLGAAFFIVLFMIIIFDSWTEFLIIPMYSLYLPQIVTNVQTGKRRALLPAYYLQMGVTRLFFPLYILACPENVFIQNLEITTSTGGPCSYVLVAWVALQMTMLYLQDTLGSRFFVPKRFLPVRYDYYRTVGSRRGQTPQAAAPTRPAPDAEGVNTYYDPSSSVGSSGSVDDGASGGGISMVNMFNNFLGGGDAPSYQPLRPGNSSEPAGSRSSGPGDVESGDGTAADGASASGDNECCICYNTVDITSNNLTAYLADDSQRCMVTPCDHIFHKQCLSHWMEIKLECPVCRAALPDLEEDGL